MSVKVSIVNEDKGKPRLISVVRKWEILANGGF